MSGPHETVEQLWQKFERMCIPADAGAVQRRESRRVFYAAVHVTMVNIMEISHALPEEQAMAACSAMLEECQAFSKAIQEGRA